MPVFFIAVNFTIGIFTFDQPINILPICASALATVSLWVTKHKVTKILLLPVFILFLVDDILIRPISLIGIINQTIGIISIIIYFIKERKNKTTDND